MQFTSKFWQGFLNLLDTGQGLSFSHHPQMNGCVCECTTSVLEQYIRCYINYQQDDYTELLPFAEVVYNNSVHGSTGFTFFRVAMGQEFNPMLKLPLNDPPVSHYRSGSLNYGMHGLW